jgi:hypothetical protein
VGAETVLVVPGALVARLVHLRLTTIVTRAAVPVLSIAAVFLLGEVNDVVGAPFGVAAFMILVLALSGAVVASARFSGTRRVPSDSPEKPAHPWMYPLDDVKPLMGWGPLTLASFRENTPP